MPKISKEEYPICAGCKLYCWQKGATVCPIGERVIKPKQTKLNVVKEEAH